MKATQNKGLSLCPPSNTLTINCYPDADVDAMDVQQSNTDPACVRKKIGYVINIADCPVLWTSCLQRMVTCSIMEADIIALAQSCRELFPVMDLAKSTRGTLGPPYPETTTKAPINKDGDGILTLVQTLSPQFAPRGNYYAIITIWFQEEIIKYEITLLKIVGVKQ